MSQTLEPLFGEAINDDAVARAHGLPPGVWEGCVPSIAGTGPWTLTLGVGADGVSRWRTIGSASKGRYMVKETGSIQVSIAAADVSHPRIDLVVGLHHWVTGPTDPTTGKPTGAITAGQKATYAVIQGTPASSPVAPTIADPYDGSGNRATVLAQVYVPVSGTPTISLPGKWDMRLPDVLQDLADLDDEVELARGTYADLKSRIDSIGGNQAFYLIATTPNTGGGNWQPIVMDNSQLWGDTLSKRDGASVNLLKPGLYEVAAVHREEGAGVSPINCSIRVTLHYTKSSTAKSKILDEADDSSVDEATEVLHRIFLVDSSWSSVYVTFERDGFPGGNMRAAVKFLGNPPVIPNLVIENGNLAYREDSGQTYPDYQIVPLVADNVVGVPTWSIVSGAGLQDGSSDPKAEITGNTNLKFTWTATPTGLPTTWSVKLQVTDDGGHSVQKTITITLSAYSAPPLTITTTDKDFELGAFSSSHVISFVSTATGGVTPYTWALVAGADTTLPSAAINSSTGVVTGVPGNTGTFKVRIRCTDSDTGPTVVEKVINITVNGVLIGPGCVPAGTPVLMADGSWKPVEDVQIGAVVAAWDDQTFEAIPSKVKATQIHVDREIFAVVTQHGKVRCSGDHRIWSNDEKRWTPACLIDAGDMTKWIVDGHMVDTEVVTVYATGDVETVYHMTLEEGHLFNSGGLVAHNMKPE